MAINLRNGKKKPYDHISVMSVYCNGHVHGNGNGNGNGNDHGHGHGHGNG